LPNFIIAHGKIAVKFLVEALEPLVEIRYALPFVVILSLGADGLVKGASQLALSFGVPILGAVAVACLSFLPETLSKDGRERCSLPTTSFTPYLSS